MRSSTAVLVLSDVEGSTRLWIEHPNHMVAVMARHHEIVHAAIAEEGGWRPIDQGEGDAVFAVFDSPLAALRAVVAAQLALEQEMWPDGISVRDRVGIHAGEVTVREGNVFGATVNRCARIRSLGAGGQVLLSASVHELVRDRLGELTPAVTLVDMGEHRMKDLDRPERLYQLNAPGLRSDFPPLAALERAMHNLPMTNSIFLGREREVSDVTALLRRERLVTITGFGGMGKTRLALQVAAELTDEQADGVWLVDLSGETDVQRIPTRLATILELGTSDGGAWPAVLAYLANKRLLLVLDNLEQLLPEVAGLVDELIRSGPGVRVLGTCREALRVAGEQDYALEPLPLPPLRSTTTALSEAEVAALPTYAAVGLFLARATAARRTFQLNSANAAVVAAICARLDGLPLALELAAARIRSMSVDALLSRLDQALQLLSGGDRTAPGRHRTLAATIAWSYDSLDESDQLLLDRLSVFSAPFTLAAAQAIAGKRSDEDDPNDAGISLDVWGGISRLVERNLLRLLSQFDDGVGDEDRYGLLATIREFASERLDRRGETDRIARRHAEHFTALAGYPLDYTPDQQQVIQQLARTDLPHLRDALQWQHDHGTAEGELRLAPAVLDALLGALQFDEVRRIAIRALDRSAVGSPLRGWVRTMLFFALYNAGLSDEARWHLTQGIPEAEKSRNMSELCDLLICSALLERTRRGLLALRDRIETLLNNLPKEGNVVPARVLRRFYVRTAYFLRFVDPDWALAVTAERLHEERDVAELHEARAELASVLATTVMWRTAEPLVEAIERDRDDSSIPPIARVNGLDAAILVRLRSGDLTGATANVDALERLATIIGGAARLSQQNLVWRAVLAELAGDRIAARRQLAPLETAIVDPDTQAQAELAWARLDRGGGDAQSSADHLATAWRIVAGADGLYLDRLLECLVEGAIQERDRAPASAARLVGLVVAHRGPFLLSPVYDVDEVLAELRERTGAMAVESALTWAVKRPLPENPMWSAVLSSIQPHPALDSGGN